MFIDGMFLPIVMNYSFIILKETFSASDLTVSLFWLIGGVSVLLGNLLIRRIDIKNTFESLFYNDISHIWFNFDDPSSQ